MRRSKEQTEISKNRILDATEELFRTLGYASIVQSVIMTKGAIFGHSDSKAELFRFVSIRAGSRI